MEAEHNPELSENILARDAYFTPESLILAQLVDDIDNAVFRPWESEE